MMLSFLFLIFSAAMLIDCQEDGNLTNVKKNPGDFVNIKATIMQALARMESNMQHQLQAVQTSVANLQTTVTELRVKETEDVSALRTKMTEDVSALQTKVTEDVSALQTKMTEDVSALQTKVTEDVSALQTKVNEDASDLRIKMAEDAAALAGKLKNVQCTNATAVSASQKARFPVAFTARFSRDDTNNGISLGHHSILRLDRVVTNIGDAYDAHTGIFTAPVNGVYVFFVSIMGTDRKGNVRVAIVTQNKVLDIIYTAGGSNHQGSGLVSTNMTAGQQAYVRQDGGTAVRGVWWTIFSGYLL